MQRGMDMEKLNRRRKEKLNHFLSITFILSGSVFDIVDEIIKTNYETWVEIHCFLKDLQFVGFALLLFTVCNYKRLKIKALAFMLIFWRTLVCGLNIASPESPLWWAVALMYAIYLIFLYRIYALKDCPPQFLGEKEWTYIEKTQKTFNVLLPVNSFRGLLQILLTRSSPRYETRLLVTGGYIYSVQNNKYVKQVYNAGVIHDLMRKAGAKIKPIGCVDTERVNKINNLLGKRTITGLRDCRRLEI